MYSFFIFRLNRLFATLSKQEKMKRKWFKKKVFLLLGTMFGTTAPMSKWLHCTTRQRQTGKKSLAVLKDSDSWIQLRKRSRSTKLKHAMFFTLILPRLSSRAESSLQRLCALICADNTVWKRERKKKKVWRKRQREQNRAQAEQKHLLNESYIYCVLEPSERLLTRRSQFVSSVCLMFPGSVLVLLRTSTT